MKYKQKQSKKEYKRTREKEKQLAQVLLSTKSIKEAEEISGVSERTIRRHLRDESFMEIYRELQEEYIEKNNMYIQFQVHKAVDELMAIIESPETTPSVKIKAIDVLLGNSFKYAGMTKDNAEKAEKDPFLL